MATFGVTLGGIKVERDTAKSYPNERVWNYEAITPNDRRALNSFLDRHRVSPMFLRVNIFQSGLEDDPESFRGIYMGPLLAMRGRT